MDDQETTTIQIRKQTWKRLSAQKEPGDSFDDVIRRLLNEENNQEQTHTRTRERVEPDPEPDIIESYRDQFGEEIYGSDDLLDRRVNQIFKMYDLLREQGEAEKDELLDVVDVDATGLQDRESVWSNLIKGKDTLRALPGVQKPETGMNTWTYSRENSDVLEQRHES